MFLHFNILVRGEPYATTDFGVRELAPALIGRPASRAAASRRTPVGMIDDGGFRRRGRGRHINRKLR
jgi:hypothetical protein